MPNTSCTAGHSGELQWQELDWWWGGIPASSRITWAKTQPKAKEGPKCAQDLWLMVLCYCGCAGISGWGGMTNYLGAVEPSNTIKLIAFFCMPSPPADSADL